MFPVELDPLDVWFELDPLDVNEPGKGSGVGEGAAAACAGTGDGAGAQATATAANINSAPNMIAIRGIIRFIFSSENNMYVEQAGFPPVPAPLPISP